MFKFCLKNDVLWQVQPSKPDNLSLFKDIVQVYMVSCFLWTRRLVLENLTIAFCLDPGEGLGLQNGIFQQIWDKKWGKRNHWRVSISPSFNPTILWLLGLCVFIWKQVLVLCHSWQEANTGISHFMESFIAIGGKKASRKGFPYITEHQRYVWGGAVRIKL